MALRKTYTNTINTKAALLDGAGGAEIGADDGPQKASSEISLRSCFSNRVQSPSTNSRGVQDLSHVVGRWEGWLVEAGGSMTRTLPLGEKHHLQNPNPTYNARELEVGND